MRGDYAHRRTVPYPSQIGAVLCNLHPDPKPSTKSKSNSAGRWMGVFAIGLIVFYSVGLWVALAPG